jgi:hypothetical protein
MDFLHSKKLLWIFAAVGLAAVIIVGATAAFYKKGGAPVAAKPAFKVEKKEIDLSKLPDKFPADIPQEKGAKVVQNYTATTNDGRFQATRVFETAKTLDENVKIYSDYMDKQGWVAGTATNTKTLRVVNGTKGDLTLQVTVNENSATKTKTVNITVTQLSRS